MTRNEKRRLLEAELHGAAGEKKPFPWKWAILGSVILLCIVALLIYFIFFFQKPFAEIPPTEEENETVLWIGETPVTRDLYDYFYKNHERSSDTEAMSAAEKEAFLREKTERSLTDFYATFSIGAQYGISPEHADVKSMYDRLLYLTRYGGTDFGYTLPGFQDEADYHSYLKNNYMTDRVYRLTMQKTAVEYYAASAFTATQTSIEKEEILAFFRNADEARRMTFCAVFYSNFAASGRSEDEIRQGTREQAELAYRVLKNAENNADFVNIAIQYSPSVAPVTIENGMYLGRYDSDSLFAPVVDTLFEMEINEVSRIIETPEGFFIIRRLDKSEEYLTNEDNSDTLRSSYLSNQFYKRIQQKGAALSAEIRNP